MQAFSQTRIWLNMYLIFIKLLTNLHGDYNLHTTLESDSKTNLPYPAIECVLTPHFNRTLYSYTVPTLNAKLNIIMNHVLTCYKPRFTAQKFNIATHTRT